MQSVTLITDWGNPSQEKMRWLGWVRQQSDWLNVSHLTDEIPPFDIILAQHFLHGYITQWPEETIHIAMVDAEALKVKRLVWLSMKKNWLLLPDHSLWHFFYASGEKVLEAATFQPGMKLVDLMIQALANLKNYPRFENCPEIQIPDHLMHPPLPRVVEGRLHGQIMWVDNFGNLETNIRASDLQQAQMTENFSVILRRQDARQGLTLGYSDVKMSDMTAFFNSRGWLEIGIRGDHAGRLLGMQAGMTVMIEK